MTRQTERTAYWAPYQARPGPTWSVGLAYVFALAQAQAQAQAQAMAASGYARLESLPVSTRLSLGHSAHKS